MMRHAWHRGRSCIGVDLAGRSIRAVQLTGGPARPRIGATASIHPRDARRPIDLEEITRLAGVLERQGFSGRAVILAVPRDRLLTATLELPAATSAGAIETAARKEIATVSGVDPDSMEIGWWALPAPARSGDALHVMVTACTHDAAAALLDLFEQAGLVVEALDLESAALLRACAAADPSESELRCVLAVDWDSTHLVVVLGEVVVYQRTIPGAGLSAVHAALAQQFGLDATGIESLLATHEDDAAAMSALPLAWTDSVARQFEPLVKEVVSSVSYVSYRYPSDPVAQVVVTGDGASIPVLVRRLHERLERPVSTYAPAGASAPVTTGSGAAPGELAAAVGLALRER
ncbi:MAG: pilus assembly protein PilM [Planctomycetota bacterium]|jgi:type IV pilus assembly protein PilM